jgi:RNA polymerase sigma-70 factor (ECF subfamily)
MGIKDLSDTELISKMKGLDSDDAIYSDVFCQYANELYVRYFSQGYNIARYYGLRNDDANDAVQNAFIKVLHSINGFNLRKEFKPWFFKIVLNCVRDRYRELSRHNHIEIDKIEKISNDSFDKFHIKDTLNGIISKLPVKLREVVVLRVYADLSFNEISEALNVSVRQLHNRLNKAYELIRVSLEEGQ